MRLPPVSGFTPEESERYGRHFVLPGIGPAGQARLRASAVLVVGAGGLGAPVLQYLAAAGVGRIGIADGDRVDLSNLQRQVIYSTARIGSPKAVEARTRLNDINPLVSVDVFPVVVDPSNASTILEGYDLVVDATDNFPARYLLNDTALRLGKPVVHGSVFRYEGQVTVFGLGDGPCYRCLFPVPPPADLVPDCGAGGVLGSLPGLIGTIQATEVVKMITGAGIPLSGRVLFVDVLRMSFSEIAASRRPGCPACGPGKGAGIPHDEAAACAGRAPAAAAVPGLTVSTLRRMLDRGERPLLLDVRQPGEYIAGNLGGVHIPLPALPERSDELDRDSDVVIICRTGSRSMEAGRFLIATGFPNVRVLEGGLVAWRREIDPSFPAL